MVSQVKLETGVFQLVLFSSLRYVPMLSRHASLSLGQDVADDDVMETDPFSFVGFRFRRDGESD